MKLSYSTLACPDWSSARAIQAAQDYGYDGIEWRIIDGEILGPEFSVTAAQRLGNEVRNAGLSVCAVDTGLHLTVRPGDEQINTLADVRKMLKLARAFGAEHLRVFLGDIPDGVSADEAAEWTRANVVSLGDDVEEAGVNLVLELHNQFAPPGTFRSPRVPSSTFAMKVLSLVTTPAVGIQWDWGNPYLEGEVASDTWAQVKSRLLYCHTKDIGPGDDGVLRYMPMGEGIVPIPEIVTWLNTSGFAGWLSFEWEKKWHPDLAEPDVALPQYVEYMRPLLTV